jgi:glycosyltransferase involved in cell wall biosynthesis
MPAELPTGIRGHPAPFFSAAGDGPARRLLLISPHFPPSDSAGALRWQKLATHAAERGWGLDVVTVAPSALRRGDTTRLEELPAGTRVFGVPPRPHALEWVGRLLAWAARARRRLRRGGRGPGNGSPGGDGLSQSIGRDEATLRSHSPHDLARAYHARLEYARDGQWARDAGRLARQLFEPGVHRVVVTCGPPHMAHCAGDLVRRETGVPFVMDMRDPWSLVERLPGSVGSPVWWNMADRFERRVLAAAALLVVNTRPFSDAMQRAYPESSDRIMAVLNGYDDEPLPAPRHGDRFVLAYAGTIYLDRDPRPLFRAAAAVVQELGLSPDEFGIELMGSVRRFGRVSMDSIARDLGLLDYVRTRPFGTRSEALDFLAEAAMLVSLPQDSDLAIPSKVFEYVRCHAWLLALTNRDSATAQVLRGSGADVVSARDVAGIARALRARVLQYRAGQRPPRPAVDPVYSRREQAKILFDRFEELVGGSPGDVSFRQAIHARPRRMERTPPAAGD